MATLVDTTIKDDLTFTAGEGDYDLIDADGGRTWRFKDSFNSVDRAAIGPSGFLINTIGELTTNAGVTIDGVLVKDGLIRSGAGFSNKFLLMGA